MKFTHQGTSDFFLEFLQLNAYPKKWLFPKVMEGSLQL